MENKRLLFTEDEIRQANEVNLVDFLAHQGEEFIPAGRSKRLKSDRSITVCENKWFDHSAEEGGYPVKFVQKFYGMDFKDSVATLLGQKLSYFEDRRRGNLNPTQSQTPPVRYQKANPNVVSERKPFVLPEQNDNMKRTFAYLTKTRGIDYNVVLAFVKEGSIAESKEYNQKLGFHYSNCVFLGRDEHGNIRHAQKQGLNSNGASFKQTVAGSEAAYSFHHKGNSGRLYVFEAPIDMMSYICAYEKDWQQHSYVALCGVGGQPIEWMTGQDKNLSQICFCLDNDEAGHSATQRFAEIYQKKGYEVFADVSQLKDWNADLVDHKEFERVAMEEERASQQAMENTPPQQRYSPQQYNPPQDYGQQQYSYPEDSPPLESFLPPDDFQEFGSCPPTDPYPESWGYDSSEDVKKTSLMEK